VRDRVCAFQSVFSGSANPILALTGQCRSSFSQVQRRSRGSAPLAAREQVHILETLAPGSRGARPYRPSELQPNGFQIIVSGKIGRHRTWGSLKGAIDRCP
jgi:hypothetical protein